ncbi:hypothetical protein TcG_02371 [Trypanosoma cruzi]|nr:hypothetical protein TcG_02371 [Trypanosoma cruzi]
MKCRALPLSFIGPLLHEKTRKKKRGVFVFLVRTHAARSHPDIHDEVPPVPAQKSSLPEPKVLFVCVYRPPFAASLGTPCCVVQSNHVCSIVLHWAGARHALSLLSEPPGGMGGPISGHLDSTLNVLDPHSSIVIRCPEDPCD